MSGKAFIDTNILVYAFFDNSKARTADAVMSRGGVISVQILNEYANVCRRKLMLDWPVIEDRIRAICEALPEVVPLTFDHHVKAVALARNHSFAIYDALLIACALSAGCTRLITEDMQHGRIINGLTIENPFTALS
ncbi:MAG: PIN domain-containing protein [Hyphomicrobiales bacterium]|nr:PIN domain-containing protein [Hyphomicrobiales bacterium]